MELETIQKLKEQRVAAVNRMREINETAEKENRDLSAEELNQFDTIKSDVASLQGRIDRAETINAMSGISNGRSAEERGPDSLQPKAGGKTPLHGTEEYRGAWGKFMGQGMAGLSPAEARSLSTVDAEGGYMMTPVKVVQDMIVALNEALWVRQFATKFTTTGAKKLGAPGIDTDVEDATWTGEVTAADEDNALEFSRRELEPAQLTKEVKISRRLLRNVPNVEQVVRSRLEYKFGVTLEKAYMTGTGSDQPLGVFVASNDGIPTSRDTAAASQTAIVFDDVIKVKFGLGQQYWPKARWMMHSDIGLLLALIREGSGTGQYIWRESVRAGEPPTLLGMPVHMSIYAPNTVTSGLYTAVLGDFSYYWVADDETLEMQRLDELYAKTGQVGIIGRWWSDGMPVLPQAFRRLKQA